MDESFKTKSNKKSVVIFAVVLSVVAIVLLGYGFKTLTSSKTVMLQSVGRFTNNAKDLLESDVFDFLKDILKEDKVSISSDVKVSLNDEELFSANFSYLENKKDEKAAFGFDINQGEEVLLDASAILANSNIYFEIKDIMDYYYTELPYITLINEMPVSEYQKVVDYFYDSIKSEIKEKDIVKSKETIKLGDKSKKTTKLSYKVDNTNIVNIFDNTIDKILDDSELVTSLSQNFGISKDEFITSLKNAKEKISTVNENGEFNNFTLYYSVYYYGFNNIVLYEIYDDNDKISIYDYDDTIELLAVSNEDTLLDIEAIEKDGTYELKGSILEYTFTGSYSNADNNENLSIQALIEGIVVELNVSEEVDKTNNKLSFEISGGLVGYEGKINIEVSFNTGESVDDSIIKNAKNIDDMTEEDLYDIINNIYEHPIFSTFYQYMTIFSGSYSDYDIDFSL